MAIIPSKFISIPLQSEQALQWDTAHIQSWSAELSKLPAGSLYLSSYRGKVCFLHALDGRRHSISKDTDLIYQLARKRYLQLLLETGERTLMQVHRQTGLAARQHLLGTKRDSSRASVSGRAGTQEDLHRNKATGGSNTKRNSAIAKGSQNSIESFLFRCQRAGLDVLRITCSQKQYAWAKAPYRRNNMDFGDNALETYSGILLRSKSERDIGNKLELYGVPYRPEMEIELEVDWIEGVNGANHGKYKRYYPDFVIPARDGKLLIWEHLGLASKEGYRIHNMEKLVAYRQGGLCDDTHLILTFERDLIKPGVLDDLIRLRVLPLL